ncbi:MAG TPA: glycosyltransferase family 4 protein [Bryobacteraceae bacterium]|jgi:glycosyltransferase involved in cell wall biosynthesis|nr:glycosyltransferase family 4 protein [Bryobacteraceae bacterium]
MSRVLYIQYTNPAGYPPLQHSSRILADAGWKVLFLGTGAAGADALTFPDHRNITIKRMEFCQPGWRQKLHYLRFCLWAFWTALLWRPRWIYASDHLSCPAALLAASLPGCQLIYHEHDSPHSGNSARGFAGFISRARAAVARRADICVVPNQDRLERYRAELGPLRNAVCVWNCPASAEIADRSRKPAAGDIWVLYHGSIVPDRLPQAVIEALAMLPDSVRLRVAGYETTGARGYVEQLRARARALNIEHRIEFLGSIPQRADLLAQTMHSDIGLALMPLVSSDWNCETMTGASNKAFDYLACGLALVVSDRPDWRGMFASPDDLEPAYARICDPSDASSIAAALRGWIEDPVAMRQAGELGRQRTLAEWNYEDMFRPVFLRMTGDPEPVFSTGRRSVDSDVANTVEPVQK